MNFFFFMRLCLPCYIHVVLNQQVALCHCDFPSVLRSRRKVFHGRKTNAVLLQAGESEAKAPPHKRKKAINKIFPSVVLFVSLSSLHVKSERASAESEGCQVSEVRWKLTTDRRRTPTRSSTGGEKLIDRCVGERRAERWRQPERRSFSPAHCLLSTP